MGGISVKRIIPLILAIVMIFAFAACKNKGNTDGTTKPVDESVQQSMFAEGMSEYEAEQSKIAEESKAEESKVQVEVDKYIEKVGYTKPQTCLVTLKYLSNAREYQKFEFKEDGSFKKCTKYYFYDNLEDYKFQLNKHESNDNVTVTDKDNDMRMIAVRIDNHVDLPFYTAYNYYGEIQGLEIIGDPGDIEKAAEIASEALLTETTLSAEEYNKDEDKDDSGNNASRYFLEDYLWHIIVGSVGLVIAVIVAVVVIKIKKSKSSKAPKDAKPASEEDKKS